MFGKSIPCGTSSRLPQAFPSRKQFCRRPEHATKGQHQQGAGSLVRGSEPRNNKRIHKQIDTCMHTDRHTHARTVHFGCCGGFHPFFAAAASPRRSSSSTGVDVSMVAARASVFLCTSLGLTGLGESTAGLRPASAVSFCACEKKFKNKHPKHRHRHRYRYRHTAKTFEGRNRPCVRGALAATLVASCAQVNVPLASSCEETGGSQSVRALSSSPQACLPCADIHNAGRPKSGGRGGSRSGIM